MKSKIERAIEATKDHATRYEAKEELRSLRETIEVLRLENELLVEENAALCEAGDRVMARAEAAEKQRNHYSKTLENVDAEFAAYVRLEAISE